MKTSTHLRKARALVNKGWCKGTYSKEIDGQLCYCSVGALNTISGEAFNDEAEEYLNYFIKNYYGGDYDLRVIGFNDHPKTKKKDVLAVFDLAIKKAVEDERRSVK